MPVLTEADTRHYLLVTFEVCSYSVTTKHMFNVLLRPFIKEQDDKIKAMMF